MADRLKVIDRFTRDCTNPNDLGTFERVEVDAITGEERVLIAKRRMGEGASQSLDRR